MNAKRWFAGFLLLAALGGCVVTPVGYRYYDGYDGYRGYDRYRGYDSRDGREYRDGRGYQYRDQH